MSTVTFPGRHAMVYGLKARSRPARLHRFSIDIGFDPPYLATDFVEI